MRNKVVISLLTATAVPMGAMANADVSAKVEASDAHKLTAEGQTGHLSEAGMLAAQALGATPNDEAYAEVVKAVADATTFYNEAVDAVVATLGNAVWTDYRTRVQEELAEYYKAIVAVGKNNGTDDAHEGAAGKKEANLAALESAKDGIEAKKNEAINKFKACEKAYADAKGVVAGFTTRFADVKKLLVDPTKPHTEDVDNIQGLIDALTAKIEEANAAHTIDELNYTEQQTAIDEALTTLSTTAAAEKANYEAKERLVAEQGKLQTAFDEAKAAAAACKEGSFDGGALWQETVDSLDSEIKACQSAIENHYGDGDCAKEEKAISDSIASAKSAVTKYQTEVEEAFADYKEAQTAIAGYQEALDAVKVYVKNPIVPYNGTTKTYGDVINGLQGRIDAVTAALNTVMAENTDGELAAALTSLDLDDVLLDEIAVITQKKYEDDKAAYDKQNKVDAAKTYATTVSSKVTEKEKKLSDLWTTLQENKAAYGLGWTTLAETKNALDTRLNAEEGNLPADGAIDESTADTWMTKLAEISAKLDTISTDIDKLAADAKTIESNVAANQEFYKACTADVNAEREELAKITTTDPDKAHEVAADKADAENQLNGFQNKIDKAYTAETLEADWSKGLATEWTEIQATIAGYVTKADQVEKNFQAYTTQKDTAQFADYLTAAAAELNKDEVCTGAGRKYFQGVLAGYKKEADDLISNIHAWYGKGKSAEHTTEVNAKTQQLIANIKAVPTLAHANDSVHTVQTNKLTEVQAEWTRVYNRFSAEDESSKKQEYLSAMANFQLRINELDKLISKAYAEGTSVQGAYEDSLTLLKVEITNKEAAWNGEYDKTLAKDNAARYERFCGAYTQALAKYSEVAGNIEKFNAVSEEYIENKAEIIKVAKDSLYKFSSRIITLKNTARDEYEHLPERTLYDPTEAHTTEVLGIIEQMDTTYADFLKQANSSACAQYADAWDNANTTVLEALEELGEGRKYDYDMLHEVFADVYVVRNENFVEVPEEDNMLATKVEGLITNLNTIPGLVAAAKEDASQLWYAATMDSLKALHDAQVDSLDRVFIYAEVEESDRFLSNYNNAWKTWIVDGAQAFGDAAVESGTMYSAYNYVVSCISQFEKKNGYAAAVAAAEQNTASLAAYAEIKDSLAATQDKLNALKAYADGYFVDGSDYVNTIQKQLDDILADADNAKFFGEAVSAKDDLLAACADAESNITKAYEAVDQEEFRELMQVWNSITIDFVSAAPELKKAGAVEKYQEKIEAYPTRMGEILKTEDAEARHAAFIALEKEMAVTKTELVALYDKAKLDGIYDELCAAITAVSEQQAAAADTLATMHQPVQDQFSEQLAAIVTAVESAQAAVDADKAASTLILYADNRKAEVAALQQQLDALTSAIDDAEAPYVANDDAYARLTEELNGYKTAADSVAERIHSYGDTYINQESFDSEMQSQVYDKLTAAAEALKAAHNATEVDEMLNEHSTLTGCSGVENALTLLDKTYSHYEGSGYINAISNRHNEVYNSFMGFKYDDETRSELASKISEIGSALWQISDTHNQAYNGYSYDEDREISVEEYCTVVVPAVRDSLAELSEQLEALQTEVEEKSYTPGDVNRDGEILVDDYSAVLDVALEYTTYEPGSVEFLAADINGDGRVNIGDVTAVARILRGENAQGVRAIARTGMQQVTDALGFAAEGTGTRQRIAISLDGSRDYVGGQLDIRLPQGVTLVGESLGQAAEGLTLQSNDLQDGAHRVLFSSPEGTLMGRSGVLLYLEVEVSHSYSGEGFDVANVLLADEAARTYALATPADGEATGVGRVSLTEEWKTKVYNLGGILMDGLKRGVNILRGSDGTSRKVIVK